MTLDTHCDYALLGTVPDMYSRYLLIILQAFSLHNSTRLDIDIISKKVSPMPVIMQYIVNMSPGRWWIITESQLGVNISKNGQPTSVLGPGDITVF